MRCRLDEDTVTTQARAGRADDGAGDGKANDAGQAPPTADGTARRSRRQREEHL